MKKLLIKKFVVLAFVGFGITTFFGSALAVDYIPLATIPGGVSTEGQSADLGTYINNLYKFGIRFAGIAAVIMIIYGGFQYIGSESIGNKSTGRKIIQDSVLGLILAIGSFVILYVLNPKILDTGFSVGGAGLPPSSQYIQSTNTSKSYQYYLTDSGGKHVAAGSPFFTSDDCEKARASSLAYYANLETKPSVYIVGPCAEIVK